MQVFHLTPHRLRGDPLRDSVLITAVLSRNILQTPLLEWIWGPGMFLWLSLELRKHHPLKAGLSLEIIPSHSLSWINKDG